MNFLIKVFTPVFEFLGRMFHITQNLNKVCMETKEFRCAECGKVISSDYAFCPYCGEKVNFEAENESLTNDEEVTSSESHGLCSKVQRRIDVLQQMHPDYDDSELYDELLDSISSDLEESIWRQIGH